MEDSDDGRGPQEDSDKTDSTTGRSADEVRQNDSHLDFGNDDVTRDGCPGRHVL